MKFNLKLYISLVFILVLSPIMNVDAAASFDGIGSPSGSSGGGGGGSCTGGYCLRLAPILKFNLVDVTGEYLNVVPGGYYSMVNPNGSYASYYRSRNVFGNGAIVGHIYGSSYNPNAFKIDEFPSEYTFSNINSIVSTSKIMYNFDVNSLKTAIISESSSDGITDTYSKIVVFMLKKAGIISNDEPNMVSELSNDIKANLNRYRIIIEPVYAFKKNRADSYMFATIKGISALRQSNKKYYGYYDSSMFYNAAAPTSIKNSSGNTILQYYDDNNWLDNMANVGHGAGYIVVQLSYNTPEVCFIEKDGSNNFIFTDSLSGKYENNLDNGSNFEYFISDGQCRCDAVNNSSYKDELLDIPIIKSIYDANCPTPKLCDYEKIGSDYKFYDNSGNILSGYEAFANKCGCYNTKVLDLKDEFSSIYNDTTVCGSEDISTTNGSFGYCTVNNTVSLTREKTVNQYCKRTCIEKIEFNNVPDTRDDIYESGKYFNLSNYPSLISTKECTMHFDYNKWVGSVGGATGYKYYLSKSVESYNDWQKYSNVSSSKGSCCDPNPYGGCYEYYYTYTSSYSGFVVNADGLNLSSQSYTANLGTYCGTKSFSVEANNASANYLSYSTTISSLKDSLNACDSAINFDVSNFYSPVNSLKFRYQQDILEINTITSMWNDANNGKKRDDSQLNEFNKTVTRYCNGVLLSASQNCEYPTENLFDNISGSSIEENTTRIKSSNLSRKEIISNTYEASVDKYIEPLTGNIVTSGTHLGKYFDIDVKAIEKNDNKNEFTFTSIGENPNSNTSLYKLTTQDNLTRACTYKTINKIIECPTGNCSDGTSSSLKILYRVVDPNNVDPNNRLGTDAGFKNWNNKKGQTVLSAIESNDTYNPENLEYSFTLDSASIKKIREYNSSCDATGNCNPIKYSDTVSSYSELSCNASGNECTSKFITELAKSNGEFGKNIATNTDGRDKWKYLIYNTSTNNWSIEVKDKMSSDTFNSLITQYKGLGVDVTP